MYAGVCASVCVKGVTSVCLQACNRKGGKGAELRELGRRQKSEKGEKMKQMEAVDREEERALGEISP